MTRSKLFVGSQTSAEATASMIGFIALFATCLVAEAVLSPAKDSATLAVFSAGAVVGSMTIAHPRWWPHITIVATFMRLGFDLMLNSGDIGTSILDTAVIMATSVGLVLVTGSVMKIPRRFVLVSELMRVASILLLFSAAIYSVYMLSDYPPETPRLTAFLLSFMAYVVGAATLCGCITGFALPFGDPPPASIRKKILIFLGTILFQLTISIGFNHWPAFGSAGLHHFELILIWLAIPLMVGIALTASSGVVALNVLGMLFVAWFGWHFELGFFVDQSSGQNLLEWQASVSGLTYVGLICSAISSRLRYVQNRQKSQSTVTTTLLDISGGRKDSTAVVDVLATVGQAAGADECRLYEISSSMAELSPISRWTLDTCAHTQFDVVGIVPVRWFHRDITNGKSVFFRHREPVHGYRPKLLESFGLPSGIEMYAVPVGVGTEAGVVIMMLAYERKAMHLRGLTEKLTIIGNFIATDRARKRANRALKRYETRLRELTTSLTESDERIRRHTSVDLHDGLIQQLAVARMKLGELRYRRVSAPDAVENLTTIIDDTLATTRRIVQELSPSVLYELGLVPGLQALCDKLSDSTHMQVTLEEEGERLPLPEPLMVSLYEVIRELLSNSQQHSGGRSIWVRVVWGEQALRYISVSDDGIRERWWSDQTDLTTGLGLLSNSERLRSFGFTTLFGERHGGGTKATVITDPNLVQHGNVPT